MFYTILDEFVLYQIFSFFKKYSNYELKLHNYFYMKTKIDPIHINVTRIDNVEYIFYFIEKESYLKARDHLNSLRNDVKRRKKITIIQADNILINLIYNLFPDLCIQDIVMEAHKFSNYYEVTVLFLKDLNLYHIAVGRNGGYIKSINKLFDSCIRLDNSDTPIKIKCKVTT